MTLTDSPAALAAPQIPVQVADRQGLWISLVDGSSQDISTLDLEELTKLQCEQEPAWAIEIMRHPKDSTERAHAITTAYSSICAILAEMSQRNEAEEFAMGMDARYTKLILSILAKQKSKTQRPGLFEIGFGSGLLLKDIADKGYRIGGLEVVPDLVNAAKQIIPTESHTNLLCGDFRKVDLSAHVGQYSVVYWNDVFEHIPPDEIHDYLVLAKELLIPGGKLVTITPNWHMRPSDVTNNFLPPRSEPVGFHLKEYTANEIADAVRSAGFTSVSVPDFISPNKMYSPIIPGFTKMKLMLEPLLEWLPYRLAVQACRRFGLNCTIATKP